MTKIKRPNGCRSGHDIIWHSTYKKKYIIYGCRKCDNLFLNTIFEINYGNSFDLNVLEICRIDSSDKINYC